MIGLATVPVNIKQATDHEKLELALVENIQRADLNPLERAFAFKRLVDEFELHPTEIARRIGVGHATVTNSIRLLQLPQEMKAALQDGSITEGQARAILGLPGEKHMLEAFAELKNRKMSVREVEHSVRIRKIKLFGGGGIMHDPILLTYEEKLRQTLGTKVLITQKGGKSNGKIIIEYFSPAELKNLVNKLTSIISSQ
jgi:ParB family chromosome partitioning protein